MVSANGNGLYSYKPLEDIFLHDPIFGTLNRKTPSDHNSACDFCLWILRWNPSIEQKKPADS